MPIRIYSSGLFMMHLLSYKRSHASVKAMKAINETIVTTTISTSSMVFLLAGP
jgi:hypothetical protein